MKIARISSINSCCGPEKTRHAQPLRPKQPNFGQLGNKLDVTTSLMKAQETLGNKINFIA